MTADGANGAPSPGARSRGGGVHRRPRRLWLGLVGGVAAAVVVGTAAFAIIPQWPQDAAALRGAGTAPPANGDATAAPSPPGAGPNAAAGARAVPPQQLPRARSRPGFPDAASTGVADGVELRRSGSVVVRQDGAVVEGLLVIDGTIEVRANDVVIRNVRITNENEFVQWGIIQGEGYGGLVVEDSEIFGNGADQFRTGISNDGGPIEVRRVEVHTITDGIMTSHGVIEDSYLHSPKLFPGDHTDMIQTVGGSPQGLPLRIRNNTVINTEPQTAAVFLDDETGRGLRAVDDVVIEGNLLAGGGYTIYGAGMIAEGHDPSNIVIRDNVFSQELWPGCGFYGPVAYFDLSAPGNSWSGNVWQDDGTPVQVG